MQTDKMDKKSIMFWNTILSSLRILESHGLLSKDENIIKCETELKSYIKNRNSYFNQ